MPTDPQIDLFAPAVPSVLDEQRVRLSDAAHRLRDAWDALQNHIAGRAFDQADTRNLKALCTRFLTCAESVACERATLEEMERVRRLRCPDCAPEAAP